MPSLGAESARSMDHFKQHFRETLELALAVYPEADVSLDGTAGIILRPVEAAGPGPHRAVTESDQTAARHSGPGKSSSCGRAQQLEEGVIQSRQSPVFLQKVGEKQPR